MRTVPARCLFLLLGVQGLFWPGFVTAEEPPAPAAAAQAAAGTSELVQRLDAISARLMEVNDHLRKPSPELAGITVALPDRTREAEAVLGGVDRLDASRADTAELLLVLQKLRNLDRMFGRWRDRLQKEVAVLDPWGEQLRQDASLLREVAGQAADAQDAVPEALSQSVADLAGQVDAVRQPLRRRLDAVVGFDIRVGQLQNSLRELAGQLDASRLARQQKPFSLTAPPVWILPEARRSLADLVRGNITVMRASLEDYLEARPGELGAFAVVMVLGCVLVLRLRRSILVPGGGAGDASDRLLIRYPVSVALLTWILVGPLILLPDLPVGLVLLRGLSAIVLLWRIMPELVPPDDVRSFRALLLLALGLLLQLVFLADPWFGRVTNILFGLLAIVVFRRLARPDSGAADAGSRLRQITRAFARLAPYVITLGILAEALGARLLGEQAIVGVIFAALVLCAFVTTDAILHSILYAWIGGPGGRWFRSVRSAPAAVGLWGTRVIRIVLLVALLNILPTVLPIIEPVWVFVATRLAAPFSVGSVEMSLAAVLWFVLSIVLALLLARFVRFLLDEDVLPRMPLAMGAASAASRLIYYALVVAGIFFALAVSGVELSRLTLVVSALSVGIGFGLQNIVNNFVSGLILAFERPVREGDLVLLGQTTGRVVTIGLRATWIRTLEGAEVVVPNANLISGEVTNWTLSDRNRRIDIPVGVAYGSDPVHVQNLLLAAIADLPGLAASPAPLVHFQAFGASSLDFRLLLWTSDIDNRLAIESEARTRVLQALRQAEIEIPFTQMDIRVRESAPPDEEPAAPPGAGAGPPVAP